MEFRTKIRERNPNLMNVPSDLVHTGFKGRVRIFANAKSFVVAHPKATLEEIEESLRIILQSIRLYEE